MYEMYINNISIYMQTETNQNKYNAKLRLNK